MLSQQDARKHFDTVMDAALAGHPQTVSQGGRPAVVVISAAEYDRLLRAAKAHRESFVNHMLAFPTDTILRASAGPRDVEF